MSGYASTWSTCKVCRVAHDPKLPHVWPDEPAKAKRKPPAAVVHAPLVVHAPAAVVVHTKRAGDRHKVSDARKAYRRDWMKRKRANSGTSGNG